MRFLVFWLGLLPAAFAASFTIHGTVLDPSGAAIAGAQVSAVNRLGVAAQTVTDQAGGFRAETRRRPATRISSSPRPVSKPRPSRWPTPPAPSRSPCI